MNHILTSSLITYLVDETLNKYKKKLFEFLSLELEEMKSNEKLYFLIDFLKYFSCLSVDFFKNNKFNFVLNKSPNISDNIFVRLTVFKEKLIRKLNSNSVLEEMESTHKCLFVFLFF